MTKFFSKGLLAVAVVAVAMGGTLSLSHAAKKGKAACVAPRYATTTCNNGFCRTAFCDLEGNWRPSLITCVQPFCPTEQAKSVKRM